MEGDEQPRNSLGSIEMIVAGDVKGDADRARQLSRVLVEACSIEEIESLISSLMAALSKDHCDGTVQSPASEL